MKMSRMVEEARVVDLEGSVEETNCARIIVQGRK